MSLNKLFYKLTSLRKVKRVQLVLELEGRDFEQRYKEFTDITSKCIGKEVVLIKEEEWNLTKMQYQESLEEKFHSEFIVKVRDLLNEKKNTPTLYNGNVVFFGKDLIKGDFCIRVTLVMPTYEEWLEHKDNYWKEDE